MPLRFAGRASSLETSTERRRRATAHAHRQFRSFIVTLSFPQFSLSLSFSARLSLSLSTHAQSTARIKTNAGARTVRGREKKQGKETASLRQRGKKRRSGGHVETAKLLRRSPRATRSRSTRHSAVVNKPAKAWNDEPPVDGDLSLAQGRAHFWEEPH